MKMCILESESESLHSVSPLRTCIWMLCVSWTFHELFVWYLSHRYINQNKLNVSVRTLPNVTRKMKRNAEFLHCPRTWTQVMPLKSFPIKKQYIYVLLQMHVAWCQGNMHVQKPLVLAQYWCLYIKIHDVSLARNSSLKYLVSSLRSGNSTTTINGPNIEIRYLILINLWGHFLSSPCINALLQAMLHLQMQISTYYDLLSAIELKPQNSSIWHLIQPDGMIKAWGRFMKTFIIDLLAVGSKSKHFMSWIKNKSWILEVLPGSFWWCIKKEFNGSFLRSQVFIKLLS